MARLAEPVAEAQVEAYGDQDSGAAYSVGSRHGDPCGRVAPLNVIQLEVADVSSATVLLHRRLDNADARPLRPNCEHYRETRPIHLYDDYSQTTRWVPSSTLSSLQRDIRKLGVLTYAGVKGTYGTTDESTTRRLKELRALLHSGLPQELEAEFAKVSAMNEAYEESLRSSALLVILHKRNAAPAADDPPAIVAARLSALGISVSSSTSMYEKLERLFQSANERLAPDTDWLAGWAYRQTEPNTPVGATVARVNRDEHMQVSRSRSRYALSYAATFKLPIVEESCVGWRPILIRVSQQFGLPKIRSREIEFEHHIPTSPSKDYRDVLLIRRLDARNHILRITPGSPFTKPTYILLNKNLQEFYRDL